MPPHGRVIVRVVAFTAEEALKKAKPEIDTFMGRTPDQEISLGDLVDVLGNDYIDGKDEKSFHFCVNSNGSYDIEAQTGFVSGGKADYLDWLARWRDDARQKADR
jgi:hypothetical protein